MRSSAASNLGCSRGPLLMGWPRLLQNPATSRLADFCVAIPVAPRLESAMTTESRRSVEVIETPGSRRQQELGANQYLDVEPHAAPLQVLQIQLEPLLHRKAVSTFDLPQSGDSGLDFEPLANSAVRKAPLPHGNGGRGPTSDISPRSTLISWGSSSRLVRRRNAPTAVTRGSASSL